jgi:hypothetical protein
VLDTEVSTLRTRLRMSSSKNGTHCARLAVLRQFRSDAYCRRADMVIGRVKRVAKAEGGCIDAASETV